MTTLYSAANAIQGTKNWNFKNIQVYDCLFVNEIALYIILRNHTLCKVIDYHETCVLRPLQ